MSKYTYRQECFRSLRYLWLLHTLYVVSDQLLHTLYVVSDQLFAVRLLSQFAYPYSQPVAHNKPFVAKHSICLAR